MEQQHKPIPHKSTTHSEEFFHFDLAAEDVPMPFRVKESGHKDKRKHVSPHVVDHITIFCRKETDGNWYASWATCMHNDPFMRARGRSHARRHYFNRSRFLLLGESQPTYAYARDLACRYITSLPHGPASLYSADHERVPL